MSSMLDSIPDMNTPTEQELWWAVHEIKIIFLCTLHKVVIIFLNDQNF